MSLARDIVLSPYSSSPEETFLDFFRDFSIFLEGSFIADGVISGLKGRRGGTIERGGLRRSEVGASGREDQDEVEPRGATTNDTNECRKAEQRWKLQQGAT